MEGRGREGGLRFSAVVNACQLSAKSQLFDVHREETRMTTTEVGKLLLKGPNI